MKDIIYSVSLLFGILIILLIILYYDVLKNNFTNMSDKNDNNIIEKYEDADVYQNEEKYNIIMTSDDIKDEHDFSRYTIYENGLLDKYKISSFLNSPSLKMLISSYEDEENVEKIEHFQWNKDNLNNTDDIIVSIDDKPIIHRFPFNPTVYGYNIKNITVELNNKKDNMVITEIAVLFNLKINDIINDAGMGQLICINNYDSHNILIHIIENNKKNNCGEVINIDDNYGSFNDFDANKDNANNYLNGKMTYDIVADINSNKYYIKNISEDIIKDPSVFLGLIINKESVHFHINTDVIKFKRLDEKPIMIDYPIYINKNKECDITLYSSALIINSNNIHGEIEKYILYNKYNLYNKMNI